MKLKPGITIKHNRQRYRGEIPDEIARELNLSDELRADDELKADAVSDAAETKAEKSGPKKVNNG